MDVRQKQKITILAESSRKYFSRRDAEIAEGILKVETIDHRNNSAEE